MILYLQGRLKLVPISWHNLVNVNNSRFLCTVLPSVRRIRPSWSFSIILDFGRRLNGGSVRSLCRVALASLAQSVCG